MRSRELDVEGKVTVDGDVTDEPGRGVPLPLVRRERRQRRATVLARFRIPPEERGTRRPRDRRSRRRLRPGRRAAIGFQQIFKSVPSPVFLVEKRQRIGDEPKSSQWDTVCVKGLSFIVLTVPLSAEKAGAEAASTAAAHSGKIREVVRMTFVLERKSGTPEDTTAVAFRKIGHAGGGLPRARRAEGCRSGDRAIALSTNLDTIDFGKSLDRLGGLAAISPQRGH